MAKERIIDGWRLGRRLGRGGNGRVFVATRGQQQVAFKILRSRSTQRVARFRDEIEAMRRCADIRGVLPVIDSYVPDETDGGVGGSGRMGSVAWLAMGLATPIREAIGSNPSLRQVVEAMRDIAGTLAKMHARGFSHRDIKPENLFRFEERWSVGDFGLADFEGKDAETQFREKIGPVPTSRPKC